MSETQKPGNEMKRKKSPLLLRKSGGGGGSSDGTRTPKQTTPPTSSASLLSVPQSASGPTTTVPSGTPVMGAHSNVVLPTEEYFSSEEIMEWDGLGTSLLSNGSTADSFHLSVREGVDEVDAGGSGYDAQRTRIAIDSIHQKIGRTKELIKSEQNSRDDNVNEYLKLASNADKQQIQRIKNVFEKKNQKSAQTIAQLQKKLDNYGKRIRDLETHGLSSTSHWQPREVLRDVGQGLKDVGANIKEGITGFSGSVMSKPREFAHLIKNRFGSADNISSVGKDDGVGEEGERNLHGSATFTHSTKYTSDDDSSSLTSSSRDLVAITNPLNTGTGGLGASPHHNNYNTGLTGNAAGSSNPSGPPLSGANLSLPSEGSSMLTALAPGGGQQQQHNHQRTGEGLWYEVEPLVLELREEMHRFSEEIDSIKSQMQQEYSYFNQALQEERYRYEHLEEQMNDLIELHQNEIENLKQGITDMEEKVQYQSEERLRDVQEVLESCQTRVSRMEHQQHQHLQQLVTLDTLENSHARALVLKLINVVLMVLQLLLLLMATLANIVMPFLQSRVRILTTSILIASIVLVCRQWPDIMQWSSQTLENHFPQLARNRA